MGNASAMGPNPPGPWSSFPLVNGQQVPVPASAFVNFILPGTTLIQAGTATLSTGYVVTGGSDYHYSTAALTATYAVVTNTSGVFIYEYILNNPTDDFLLNQNTGGPSTTVATPQSFSVNFNTQPLGAYLSGSAPGNLVASANMTVIDNGTDAGVSFTAVNPGSSSPTLWFQSSFGPTMGLAFVPGNSSYPLWSGSVPVPIQ
jgi:hypothetical protein